MKIYNYLLITGFFLSMIQIAYGNYNPERNFYDPFAEDFILVQDTIPPLEDRPGNFSEGSTYNPFDLKDPSIIEQNVEYDPATGQYIISETIGDDYFRMPSYMTFDEYLTWRTDQQEKAYFDKLAGVSNANNSGGERVDPISKIDVKNSLVDRLFGGVGVDIRPQGNIDLTFGVDFQNVQNPLLTERQRRQGGFDFDMGIQMNVIGKIGDKLNLATSYNTQATFNFENKMKLEYDSDQWSEDEIIKKIEAGNVSFPLNTSLIQGSQSLFGLRVDTQWGKLKLKAVASQQKSKRENISIDGGSQEQNFEVFADEYDENRHFFLTHYFRDVFESSLQALPEVRSLVKITNLQVWVTNDRNDTEQIRDIVALADIGEPTRITNNNPQFQAPVIPVNRDLFGTAAIPSNDANPLFDALISNPDARSLNNAVSIVQNNFGFTQTKDFEKVSARKLTNNEYTFNPDLGFVSININLRPDQVLGVAFEYDYNGETYKVGELADDTPSSTPDSTSVSNDLNVLFVKMLKSTTPRVDLPAWDLMMKNVYSIGAFQVNNEDFKLDIFYEDPGGGEKRFLPESNIEGVPLLRVFNLDQLNVQGDPQPDGVFDFVPNVTINLRNGRVMFPVLEPFGNAISDQIDDPALKRRYSYYELYDSTVIRAREFPEFNRFTIRGSYKSSVSAEISLGSFNLPQGSVRVSAGGYQLIEGQDYEVDYNIGRVKIINDALLNSGVPINISFEDNTLFGFQTKTLVGLRGDYEVSKNLNIGGTFMHLFERPFTQKVNVGDDPINNKVYGLDINYSKESPWLTKMVDKIPLINTKEKSNISFMAEAAYLKPGHSKAIDLGENEDGGTERGGVVYVDDFEGSASSYDLRTPANAWVLSSIPQNDENNNNPLFPESQLIDDLEAGVNRAKLNWYRIDRSALSDTDVGPYTAPIPQNEVFPNLQITPGANSTIQTFDMTFDPNKRGPYNFDIPNGGYANSAGIRDNGDLNEPETRWGGIMRDLNTTNFEAANIEFIEFWMLNPFMEKADGSTVSQSGNLYINLGNVSEDILRDSRKFFENGIPSNDTTPTDTTSWGRIPRTQAITNAFSNEESVRTTQDVGLDGLDNVGETAIFKDYLATINASSLDSDAKNEITADPSNDDFQYYRDADLFGADDGIFVRYNKFNNPEGNSASSAATGQLSSSTNLPDSEDINNDNTLSETESYFQYQVPMERDGNELKFNKFIIDSIQGTANRVWYRVKIPVDQPTKRVGGIQDFRSIRFIRMYMNGFNERVTLRFARLELVRNQWRRYLRNTSTSGPQPPQPNDQSTFDVNAVNIEENSTQRPFGYVLPPGIDRERSIGAFPDVLQNEQSLSMEICNLAPEKFKAIYKIVNLDMRVFKRLQMDVHAESINDVDQGDLSIFMRLGSDFENNYYEYEVPLVMSTDDGLVVGSDEYKNEVWRIENKFNFPMELFKNVKVERNQSGKALNEVYLMQDPEKPLNAVKVVGNPNLNLVKGVMIGVYNNDEFDQCTEVWINELRLSGLDERAGWAAVSRLDMQLADFGSVTGSINYSSRGYGEIGQKLAQRSREDVLSYDITGSAELSKFFPEKWGLRLPFYGQYSNTVRTPEFDPYDRDIPLKEKLDAEQNATKRDSLKEQAIDVTEIKSFNITNARKERTNKDKTPMPWDISNFSFTYAYSQTNRHDPIIELDKIDDHYASVDYAYSLKPKYITPFKNLSKNKHLKLITDLNFNLVPNTVGVNTQMDRQIQSTRYRFAGPDIQKNTFYNKQFTWDRNYNLQWDLTKNLKVRFNAINESIIDELPTFDPITEIFNPTDLQKDFIKDNIRDGGRTKNYRHDLNASYTVPFKSIPVLDWVTVKAQYSADYAWNGSSLVGADSLGNIIQNGQTRQLNADFNFEQLYNKSKYLKKINKKKSSKSKSGKRSPRGSDDTKGTDLKSGSKVKGKDRGGKGGKGKGAALGGGSLEDRLNTPSIKNRVNGKDGKNGGKVIGKDGSKTDPVDPDNKGVKLDKDGKKKKTPKKKKKKKKKEREPSQIERIALRPLMLIRKARASYTENLGTTIPGYQPKTKFFGLNDGFSAPGWDFVGGIQPDITDNDFSNDWLTRSSDKGWITDNVFQNKQVLQNYSQNIDGKITLEPFNDFRIELDANRSFTENSSLYFRDTTYDTTVGNYEDIVHTVPRDVGSYSISYFTLQTLFDDDLEGLFKTFEDNRVVVSERLGITGAQHELDPEFNEGFGRYQRDVLIPSFLAAYSDKDARTFKLDVFKTIPKINWRLTYNGLAKLDMFKDIFSSMSLSHSYKSTMTVNSFQTNRDFDSANQFQKNPTTNNYYSKFDIPEIVITEAFAPLIGLDMKLKNDMTLRADWKKSRNLAMSFVDSRLNETKTTEFVIGYGYRVKDVYLAFLYGKKGKKRAKKKKPAKTGNVTFGTPDEDDKGKGSKVRGSDLNFKFDISYRDDVTYLFTLDENILEPTRGSETLRISPSIDYDVNKRLNIRVFYDYSKTIPKTSASFPITNTQAGVTIRFSLD